MSSSSSIGKRSHKSVYLKASAQAARSSEPDGYSMRQVGELSLASSLTSGLRNECPAVVCPYTQTSPPSFARSFPVKPCAEPALHAYSTATNGLLILGCKTANRSSRWCP